jgi:hypothetical protein
MSEQKYGVVYGEGIEAKIVKICSTYEIALEEAMMFTMETGAEHTVQPVKPKVKAK